MRVLRSKNSVFFFVFSIIERLTNYRIRRIAENRTAGAAAAAPEDSLIRRPSFTAVGPFYSYVADAAATEYFFQNFHPDVTFGLSPPRVINVTDAGRG